MRKAGESRMRSMRARSSCPRGGCAELARPLAAPPAHRPPQRPSPQRARQRPCCPSRAWLLSQGARKRGQTLTFHVAGARQTRHELLAVYRALCTSSKDNALEVRAQTPLLLAAACAHVAASAGEGDRQIDDRQGSKGLHARAGAASAAGGGRRVEKGAAAVVAHGLVLNQSAHARRERRTSRSWQTCGARATSR